MIQKNFFHLHLIEQQDTKIHGRWFWKLVKRQCKAYNPTFKKCNPCLRENLQIIDDPDKITEQEVRSNLSMLPLTQV